ncbi:MAG TPA: SDR family oxidoreductase [Candidatus Eremiobacteraceae bacterium]|nr:SDR family oxidoreductase [Candidatus Eremiobacteraceae bacterium]
MESSLTVSSAPTALVTGSATGLMRGVCVSLGRRGYRIACNYRPERGEADDTLAFLRGFGIEAAAFSADVADAEQAESLVQTVVDRLGRLDVLVCGAGPMVVRDLHATEMADYRAMIDGNLTSVYACSRAALKPMRSQHHGRIITFGMTGSETTQGFRHLSAYAAAKAAVVAFTKSIALEEGPFGITCNAICIGDIRDKTADRATALERREYRNPTTRPGSWQDIGDAVAYLASDDASFVNGAVLTVGGGWQGFFADYSRWP